MRRLVATEFTALLTRADFSQAAFARLAGVHDRMLLPRAVRRAQQGADR